MSTPVRIFVGCATYGEDIESQAVLEWSIRKHASLPVELTWMQQSAHGPFSAWNTERWATPFSGFRWAIPELCRFTGKAIYMDSDVIVMADIAELWAQQHEPGRFLIAKGGGAWRICVSMFDCAEAREHIPPLAQLQADASSHRNMCALIKQRPELVQAFEGEWNCLDREVGERSVHDPSIKAIHYTDMRSQPQLRHALPRLQAEGREHWHQGTKLIGQYPKIDALFDELLEEATANGCAPERYAR